MHSFSKGGAPILKTSIDSRQIREMDMALARMTFQQRENSQTHFTYAEERVQFGYILNGDLRAVDEALYLIRNNRTGKLSPDPIRNYQYLFVSEITVLCRVCIRAGMPEKEAYGLSDLYIQNADRCTTEKGVLDLYERMVMDYTLRMKKYPSGSPLSRPVRLATGYIDDHLHERILLEDIAAYAGVSPSYLSTLFRKETGKSIPDFINEKKIREAVSLLSYSEFSCSDISEYLGFSTPSYFSSLFRKIMGMTPVQFRRSLLKPES